jgi:hypothetical protein
LEQASVWISQNFSTFNLKDRKQSVTQTIFIRKFYVVGPHKQPVGVDPITLLLSNRDSNAWMDNEHKGKQDIEN